MAGQGRAGQSRAGQGRAERSRAEQSGAGRATTRRTGNYLNYYLISRQGLMTKPSAGRQSPSGGDKQDSARPINLFWLGKLQSASRQPQRTTQPSVLVPMRLSIVWPPKLQ